jgi:hypothetical protein
MYYNYLLQLKPYHQLEDPPTSPMASEPVTTSACNWADSVLGLNDDHPDTYASLEAEVNAYLHHTHRATTILGFWQVCFSDFC